MSLKAYLYGTASASALAATMPRIERPAMRLPQTRYEHLQLIREYKRRKLQQQIEDYQQSKIKTASVVDLSTHLNAAMELLDNASTTY